VPRTDNDTWDLASSVGATATAVAASRAAASRGPDPLLDDPYAAPLVHAVGIEHFIKIADGELAAEDDPVLNRRAMNEQMAVRTRYFDDFFTAAAEFGVRQAVILAAGLDTRAYRLAWPAGTTVFELDQPEVIEFKSRTLADLGATPTAQRRTVAIDLREDWPKALLDNGFDPKQPTAWIAEGLLVYLPPEAQDRLFDNITALSAAGSQLATEYHPDGGSGIAERTTAISDAWGKHGFDVKLKDLFYDGDRTPVAEYLTGHGWQVYARTRSDVFAGYGREFPDTEGLAPIRNSLSVIATKR